ncbi:unnamed protein product [Paramecium primaurelia]|uniref:Uncharacterized protein n=1 Tax=Paramecium primaurelia TaxID=5886 RepID=A0A8S1KIJ5_PARPR|nr:unnamed protein product [Paramecium primaurelia]
MKNNQQERQENLDQKLLKNKLLMNDVDLKYKFEKIWIMPKHIYPQIFFLYQCKTNKQKDLFTNLLVLLIPK